uniref:Uncharacterized protein n=1 Tax=viral metagenome TaxID=1070528 RepID=A0A6C0JS82_9ZZZZ
MKTYFSERSLKRILFVINLETKIEKKVLTILNKMFVTKIENICKTLVLIIKFHKLVKITNTFIKYLLEESGLVYLIYDGNGNSVNYPPIHLRRNKLKEQEFYQNLYEKKYFFINKTKFKTLITKNVDTLFTKKALYNLQYSFENYVFDVLSNLETISKDDSERKIKIEHLIVFNSLL